MDYNRNVDKLKDCLPGVSYNQVIDVDNNAAILTAVVSLSEFKIFGKIDTDEEDTLISALIVSAQRMCEQWVGINFISREVTAVLNNSNGGSYLPYGPISGTITGADIDGTGVDIVLTGTAFKQLRTPVMDWVQVTYTGGYATGQCPEEFITAVKMQTLHMYENRGDVNLSSEAQSILTPLKRI